MSINFSDSEQIVFCLIFTFYYDIEFQFCILFRNLLE